MSFPGWPAVADPGWWRVDTIIPPAVEPVSLAEAKTWARVEYPDEDALIIDLIQACREKVEADLKRALISQTKTIYFQGFPTSGGYFNPQIRAMGPNPFWLPGGQGIIKLPYPPVQSIVSVKYLDVTSGILTTIPALNYIVSAGVPGRIQPKYGSVWPLNQPVIDGVQVSYVCGYGDAPSDIPASVRIALRMLIAGTFEHREAWIQGGALMVSDAYERLLAVEDWGNY